MKGPCGALVGIAVGREYLEANVGKDRLHVLIPKNRQRVRLLARRAPNTPGANVIRVAIASVACQSRQGVVAKPTKHRPIPVEIDELDEFVSQAQRDFNRERLEIIRSQRPDTEILHLTDEERERFRQANLPVRDARGASTATRRRTLFCSSPTVRRC